MKAQIALPRSRSRENGGLISSFAACGTRPSCRMSDQPDPNMRKREMESSKAELAKGVRAAG